MPDLPKSLPVPVIENLLKELGTLAEEIGSILYQGAVTSSDVSGSTLVLPYARVVISDGELVLNSDTIGEIRYKLTDLADTDKLVELLTLLAVHAVEEEDSKTVEVMAAYSENLEPRVREILLELWLKKTGLYRVAAIVREFLEAEA